MFEEEAKSDGKQHFALRRSSGIGVSFDTICTVTQSGTFDTRFSSFSTRWHCRLLLVFHMPTPRSTQRNLDPIRIRAKDEILCETNCSVTADGRKSYGRRYWRENGVRTQ